MEDQVFDLEQKVESTNRMLTGLLVLQIEKMIFLLDIIDDIIQA